MRTTPVALLLILVLSVGAVEASNPGARATLTKDGVNHMIARALPNVLASLQAIKVDDVHGTSPSPIGTIQYNVTNIVIQDITIASFSVDLQPPSTILVSAAGLGLEIALDWSYVDVKYPDILHDSGTAVANSSDSSFWISAAFTEADGRPQVVVQDSNVTIGDLSIDIHGGEAWLYNLLEGLFQKFLVSSAETSIEQALATTVNRQVAQILATLNLDVKLDDTASVDFSMAGPPTISTDYLSLPDKGQFYSNADHSTAPGSPTSTPLVSDSNPLQFFLTSYVMTSASFVYQRAGKLSFHVYQRDIPQDVPIVLNTKAFQFVIPELYKKYPNQAMAILGTCPTPPAVTISAKGLAVEFHANLDFRVLSSSDPDSSVSAFVIGVVAQSSGSATVQGTSLQIKLSYLSAQLKEISSNVGSLDVSVLSDLVDSLLRHVITPLLNLFISKGIPIPSVSGLVFVNPEVKFGDGYLFVSTDIDYHPPSSRRPGHPRGTSTILVQQQMENEQE